MLSVTPEPDGQTQDELGVVGLGPVRFDVEAHLQTEQMLEGIVNADLFIVGSLDLSGIVAHFAVEIDAECHGCGKLMPEGYMACGNSA